MTQTTTDNPMLTNTSLSPWLVTELRQLQITPVNTTT